MNTEIYWKGRPITDLSREELLEVIDYAMKEIEEERKCHAKTLNMWSLFRKARLA